jgi:8-oxo-dGTP pyrophosphatase MutT (NUDIX family)
MSNKTKKAQVVVAAFDQASHNFFFLLLQTNQQRGSFWQNVTGKVETGETYEEGALREAIEETGLKIESIVDMVSLGLRYEFIDKRQRDVQEESFLIILDDKWNIKIDSSEHQNYQWLTIDEINRESVKFESNYETLKTSQRLLRHWGR